MSNASPLLARPPVVDLRPPQKPPPAGRRGLTSKGAIAGSCAVVCLAFLIASDPAAAAKRITGKLSKPDYTVIAVAANGKAKAVRARTGKFKLRPPAKRVTLHLRAPDGTYAGPVVVGRKKGGRGAVLGVRVGARLGRIGVLRGYAKLARRLRRKWVDGKRIARARKGIPIGARRFGRVRSRRTHGGVRGDRDLDGIPNPLDIDDDGDRILDNLDRPKRARASLSARQEFNFEFNLAGDISDTLNANATDVTPAETDPFLVRNSQFVIERLPGDSAELDCGYPQLRTDPLLGGLRYCTKGGTGRLSQPGSGADLGPFPECCDADGDGFGSLGGGILLPRATSADIGSGDILIQRVTNNGVETHFASTLQYVFATVPALVSYSDTAGNCAKVSGTSGNCATEFSYPVPGANCGTPPCPPPGLGTRENPFPVKAGSSGDVIVTLTFWRPQRRPIAGESGEWTDVGGLTYGAGFGERGRPCPQRAFSTSDSLLTPDPQPGGGGEDNAGGYRDRALDRPASPANTFSYSLNLTECLTAKSTNPGVEAPWNPGVTKGLDPSGTDQFSYTGQGIFFKRR